MRQLWRRIAIAAGLVAGLLLVLRWVPHASLQSRMPLSMLVLDMRGEPLRITLADDGQLRLWTPLAQIPAPLVEAVLLHEDQHFYWHPGINPVALVRATRAVVTGGAHQGASTITMQLVRLLQRHNTRSVGDKLQQIAGALWLEARYSKKEILEAYLNLAPYGGNVQGVGAASRLSFGKPVQDLDLAQRLALAVLPQAPQARAPDRIESDSLHAARLRLFARWLQVHPEDARLQALVESPLRFARTTLPFAAPHFTTMALRQIEPADGVVRTTLDARLQALLERRLREHLQPLKREGVRNASALLIDTRSMAVRAWLGSADYFDPAIDGQVDGVLARRSPGSTLKPALYALAMDQGLIHPLTVLKDAPTSFGPFTPENSDGRFLGPITAHDALIRSRNVPAVQLSAALGDPTLYRFLKSAGVHLPKSERHYGLALTLGGGEVSMVELAQLYAMLANCGVYHEARWQSDLPEDAGRPLLSEAASYMVLDILRDNPRPDEAQAQRTTRRALMPAWKTGTSWGFHDAWTAGVIGPYVLVVWVGNFDGEANPAFVGVQVAAPLFFDLADALRTYAPIEAAPSYRTPPQIARVDVCAASGDLPNADCPHRASTWFIPGVSPIRVSNVHRRVRIDTRSGRQACPDTPASDVHEEVFEFWPSDLMRLYAQAGLPRRAPPLPGNCDSATLAPGAGFTAVSTGPRNGLSGTRPPQIVSPLAGVSYPIAAEALGNEVIPLQANADGAARTLYWFAGGNYLGAAKPGEAFSWKPLRTGRTKLSVTDDLGASDARTAEIRLR